MFISIEFVSCPVRPWPRHSHCGLGFSTVSVALNERVGQLAADYVGVVSSIPAWDPRFTMRAPLAACREPAGKLWQVCKVVYVSEHKTQYLLTHAPFVIPPRFV